MIIFQNSYFVVIDKPGAVLSVPSRKGHSDARPVAGIMLQDHLKQKVFPVHRLDEDVSGLLLFALTPESHRVANHWFEHHKVRKTYLAHSVPVSIEAAREWRAWTTWECKLMRGKKRAYEADFGKTSITRAMFMGHNDKGRSEWHLMPLTGRSHQLRYEMMRHGFPIDRDVLYSSQFLGASQKGIDLRAIELDFSGCERRLDFSLPEVISTDSSAKP